ncbi:MAG: DEAD/DEAH box helicase [Pirellulales bacterium]
MDVAGFDTAGSFDAAGFIDRLKQRPDYGGQISHVRVIEPRAGQYAEPSRPLPDGLARLLAQRGITQLYSHQVDMLERARQGRDVAVVSGTASGKTLCYNLPVLETCLAEPNARALYLYPTKALAQDQLKGLMELIGDDADLTVALRPGVYDGDTPTAERRRIRGEANLVLSNPDMLHTGILPHHPKWGDFFTDLKYVILDEVHNYRGILGANIAAVIRRVMRVCAHYGNEPQFLAASATIANPAELLGRLVGRDVDVVECDGAPRGRKYFVLWNPSPLGDSRLARRNASEDAAELMVEALQAGGQTLAFTRTRQQTELIYRDARERLEAEHSPLARQIRAYRGGYLPQERRAMERDLFSGKLRGVAATNALELGIDVGSLDVTLLVGYPGTIASTWQQAGRSGRRQGESLAMLLAGNDAIDQYLMRHPDYFFAQLPEHAVVDPENPYVLTNHLQAAAFEIPLDENDVVRFGPMAAPIAESLADEGVLTELDGKYYFAGGQNPAIGVSLQHMSDNTFSIVERGEPKASRRHTPTGVGLKTPPALKTHEVIANVDAISAPELVYPEAVYLHDGQSYLVRELDLDGKVAYVERRETDYFTQAVLESNVRVKQQRQQSAALPVASVAFGDADVSWQTVAFKKIKFATKENIGMGPVEIPEQTLSTTALWLVPGDAVRGALKSQGRRTSEALVGLRNLALVAMPIVAMCDPRDLGGVVDSKNFGTSSLILYDRYPGGLGYCEKGMHQINAVLQICAEMIRECQCEDGCPSCVGMPNLRPAIHSEPDLTRGFPMPNKQATLALLDILCPAELATTTLGAE